MCLGNHRGRVNNHHLREGHLVSWNSRGISNKKEELQILTQNLMPISILIQESKIKENQNFVLKNYSFEHKPLPINENEIAKGGVGIFIRNEIPYISLNLNTNFQAIAVQLYIHKKITLCSIYIPPDQIFNQQELENLIQQLPKPFILSGDFNSHNEIWFDKNTDAKGRIVENFILENNLCILDENNFTFSRGNTQSHIDLTLVSPELYVDFVWSTYDDQCGSDHVPIIIKTKNKLNFEGKPRWNLEKADWTKFQEEANFNSPVTDFSDIDELCQYITQVIINAATTSIPLTKPTIGKISVPWWNGCCRIAVNNKKCAYRRYIRTPTLQNYNLYKKANSEAKRIVRKSKLTSWTYFLSGINSKTPIKQLWSKIGSLKKKNNNRISMLKSGNTLIDKPFEIANTLAKSMSDIASSKNRTENFIRYKNENEKHFSFNQPNHAPYNVPITKKEILDVLNHCSNSATGEDQIHYHMIKNLTDPNLEYIRNFYNIIFTKHIFPTTWSEALIIPILKPQKDPQNPKSYRPISLLSCLYKVLDTIINNRLIWFLEKNNLLNKCQSGGRRGRNTMDHVCSISTEIQEAFANQKYHVTIFLDFENAYDKSWKNHILQQLENFNMSGHLPSFIQNFLTNRSIKVNVNNHKSNSTNLEMGVPQGSSLSATLFLISVNSLVDKLPRFIGRSLFVDDCRVSIVCYDLQTATEELQKVLNTFESWCDKTGFTFSTTKTKILICHRKKRVHPPKITLLLNQKTLECVLQFKFLGVILDSKLTWIPHLMKIKEETFNNINLLKIISSSKFKTSTQNLINIYKTLILPKIEYGSAAYLTGTKSNLKLLDPIHHKCLRICLGAFRTTPIQSLYVESNIPSLENRRKILCTQYYFRTLEIDPSNTSINFQNPSKDLMFINRKRGPFPVGMLIRKYLNDFEIGTPKITPQKIPIFPPWFIPQINICLELNQNSKKHFTPTQLKQSFLVHKHKSRIEIFTDGSKTPIGTGAGISVYSVENNCYNSYKVKLNKLCSIYTAELTAIKVGLQSIEQTKNTTCTVYSDSKSSLISLNQFNPKLEILKEIHTLIFKITTLNKTKITFCWVPAHCDIRGNELADQEAKLAANIPRACLKPISASDMKPHIKSQFLSFWKEKWNSLNYNKLKNIGTEIGKKFFGNFSKRIEEIKFTRIRLGHTRLTHSYHFTGDEAPMCEQCRRVASIKHILLLCPRFYNERKNHFGNSIISIKELLDRKNPDKNKAVINFLQSTNLFKEI